MVLERGNNFLNAKVRVGVSFESEFLRFMFFNIKYNTAILSAVEN